MCFPFFDRSLQQYSSGKQTSLDILITDRKFNMKDSSEDFIIRKGVLIRYSGKDRNSMTGNEYNEVWAYLEKADPEVLLRLPGKLKELIKDNMVPNGETRIGSADFCDNDLLSEKASTLLGLITMLYFVDDDQDRWGIVENFHRNQLIYDGKEVIPMSEEIYQESLKDYDEWNELFGLIPFWGESRRWQPKICYELVRAAEETDMIVGKYGLKEIYVLPENRELIVEEAKQWVLLQEIRETKEYAANPEDSFRKISTKETEDFYKENVVILDGHFFGVLLNIINADEINEDLTLYKENGLLLINGKTAGETTEYERSIMTDEYESIKETHYSLKRKSGE